LRAAAAFIEADDAERRTEEALDDIDDDDDVDDAYKA
jgi:hypothetical protein